MENIFYSKNPILIEDSDDDSTCKNMSHDIKKFPFKPTAQYIDLKPEIHISPHSPVQIIPKSPSDTPLSSNESSFYQCHDLSLNVGSDLLHDSNSFDFNELSYIFPQ